MPETQKSLLLRVCDGDDVAWERFADLYQPLLFHWLRRQSVEHNDAEDLAQEILLIVMKQLPDFTHAGRPGAFRAWLRTITFNRARDFWKTHQRGIHLGRDSRAPEFLEQLEDPQSDLAQQWNQEHDQYVLRCLLDVMDLEFEPRTVRAFRRVALEGASAQEVALELGMSVGAVYVARSRVLQRIRQEADGLLDAADEMM